MRAELYGVYLDGGAWPVVVAVEEFAEPEWGVPLVCPFCIENRGCAYYLTWGERRCAGDPTTAALCPQPASVAVDVDDGQGWQRRAFCAAHAPAPGWDCREPTGGLFGEDAQDVLEVACGKCGAEFPAFAAGLITTDEPAPAAAATGDGGSAAQ